MLPSLTLWWVIQQTSGVGAKTVLFKPNGRDEHPISVSLRALFYVEFGRNSVAWRNFNCANNFTFEGWAAIFNNLHVMQLIILPTNRPAVADTQ